jgi:hypothetical protein
VGDWEGFLYFLFTESARIAQEAAAQAGTCILRHTQLTPDFSRSVQGGVFQSCSWAVRIQRLVAIFQKVQRV